MKMNGIWSVLFLSGLWLSCSGVLPPPDPGSAKNINWEMFGGDPSHSGFRDISIQVPLREKWQVSLTTIPGKAFIAIGGMIYAGCLDGTIHSVNIATGELTGQVDLGGALYGSPVVQGDYLITALGIGKTTLSFYDFKQQKVIFRRPLGPVESCPVVLRQILFIAGLNQNLYAYSIPNASEQWVFRSYFPIRSSPAFSEGILIIADDGGFVYGVNLEGKKIWEFQTRGAIFGSPTISKNRVYIGSNDSMLYCLDLQKGSFYWKQPLHNRINSTPACDDQTLFLGTNGGTFFALDKETGKIQWQFLTKSIINTPAVVTKDKILFGSLDHFLYCLNKEDGKLLWKFETSGRIRTAPALWKNILLVAAEDNNLYAFESEP